MPSGKTHKKINLSFFFIVTLIQIYVGNFILKLFINFGFLYGTFFQTPDLDQEGTESDKAWGVLEPFWDLYARLFTHRKISHNIWLGTLSRLFYIFCILILPVIIYRAHTFHINEISYYSIIDWLKVKKEIEYIYNFCNRIYFVDFFIGLFLSDSLHILVDELNTFKIKIKSRKNKIKK